MASQWHYKHKVKECGPISSAQLKALPDAGGLEAFDLVWKEGMAEWVPAGKLKGLFPDSSSTVSLPIQSLPPPVPKRPQASSPSRSRGEFLSLKRVAIGGIAAVLLIGATLVLWPKSRSADSKGMEPLIQHPVTDSVPRLGPSIAVSPAPSVARQPLTIKLPVVQVPDFSKVDYLVDFNDADYKCDFSKIDYSKGPQGEPVKRHLVLCQSNILG